MKLCVPTTWEDAFIAALSELDSGFEVYGTPAPTILGGGRPAGVPATIGPEQVQRHIDLVRRRDMAFNLVVGAPCFSGKELDPAYRKRMFDYLDWVDSLEVDMVTVTHPGLGGLIRKHYPDWSVAFEPCERANLVNNTRYFSNVLGDEYDRITIPANLIRDFDMIAKIRRNIECSLEVIVNEGCLLDCPWRFYHRTLQGHFSREDGSHLEHIDFPRIKCSLARLDPEELVKSTCIRPEDCHIYEQAGIQYFKLSGAGRPASWLQRCAGAYAGGRYDGNLLDLLDTPCPGTDEPPPYHLDNRSLDGFIDFFLRGACGRECGRCDYCAALARKAVRARLSDRELESLREKLETALSRSLSRTFSRAAGSRPGHPGEP